MAIRYRGTDIIRDYKGFTIRKTTNICREVVYIVEGYTRCITLKEAKRYIDKLISK